MWHTLLHALEHAWKDTLPLLPWLVIVYVVIELLENKTDLSQPQRKDRHLLYHR